MSTFGDPNQSGGQPTPPAGWYPVDGGSQRYWDGSRWTEHIAPGPGPTPWHPQPEGGGQPDQFGATQTPFGQPESSQPPFGQAGANAAGFGQPMPYGQQANAVPGGPPFDQVPMAMHQQWNGQSPSSDDRTMAMLIHVLALVTGFLGPLILWLVKKDQSPYVDFHGKEAINFQLSLLLYWFGVFILAFFLIGLLVMPLLIIFQLLFPIMAAIAANRGEYYRYPLNIRFIN